MNLSAFLSGRDNNLNLLRLFAALAVILSHSFVLTTGRFDDEPLRQTLGMSLGDIAVDLFFVVSGLLVTGSLLRRGNLKAYFLARAFRIYPGLIVMLLLVNIPLGLFLTELHWQEYLTSPGLRGNFVHNILLVKSAWTSLPGVLSQAPWPHAVNGSLWTLTYEVRLYIWLGACFAIARLFRKHQGLAFAALIWATWIVALSSFAVADHGRGGNPIPRLVLMFASGMLMHQYRERLRISWSIATAAFALLVIAWIHGPSFRMAYGLIVPYLFVALAYLPNGAIRIYNRAGDYSFGLYIYAFPIQQSLVLLRPEDSPLQNATLSTLITLVFAWFSWNLVEKRLQYRPPQAAS